MVLIRLHYSQEIIDINEKITFYITRYTMLKQLIKYFSIKYLICNDLYGLSYLKTQNNIFVRGTEYVEGI